MYIIYVCVCLCIGDTTINIGVFSYLAVWHVCHWYYTPKIRILAESDGRGASQSVELFTLLYIIFLPKVVNAFSSRLGHGGTQCYVYFRHDTPIAMLYSYIKISLYYKLFEMSSDMSN
jgi:hypothetical protein